MIPFLQKSRDPGKTVAILVPGSERAVLTPEEEISLRHLRHFLAPYDKFLIVPKKSHLHLEGLKSIEFSRKYFGSMEAHCRLLSDPNFYRRFSDYKYILIYHLDALVLRDELLEWCKTDVDYIGAPWLNCPDSPWVTHPRVGNGGFALMKVKNVLEVFHRRHRKEPDTFFKDLLERNRGSLKRLKQSLYSMVPKARVSPVQTIWNRMSRTELSDLNNDLFWADHAVKYFPEFKVASFEQGLRFAFEVAPRTCFQLNHGKLPFGCHAWPKYDKAFWEPFLLR